MIAGVIFDFDGVVVDSLATHLNAWKKAHYELYGMPLTDTEGLPGRSTDSIAGILSERVGQPKTRHKLADLKRQVLKNSHEPIPLLPGVPEVFQALLKLKIPMAIGSNAPRAFIEDTLKSHHIRMDIIFGIDDVQRGKPAPDVFLKCATSMKISVTRHADVLVFEDSTHGLEAAIKAGMTPIGLTTQHSKEILREAGAKYCYEHLHEALQQGCFTGI